MIGVTHSERYPTSTAFPYVGREENGAQSSLDSVALLRLCANEPDNTVAWNEFFSRFINSIRYFVKRASRRYWAERSPDLPQPGRVPPPDPGDLLQEVFLRLVANNCLLLKQFEGETEEAILRYLSVICTSTVINHYRYTHRKKRFQYTVSLEEARSRLSQETISISQNAAKMESSLMVGEIMQILDNFLCLEITGAETRVRNLLIFKWYFFYGFSVSEIASCRGIGLSRSGVSKILTTMIGYVRDGLNHPNRRST